jgi:molecular chaperone GrpE
MTDANTDAPRQADETDQATVNDNDRVAALEAETAELRDRALRALAEVENIRRRTDREVRDARTYAISSFARDALVVADNLRRTIEAVGADARQTADASLKALLDGVELTEREFLKVLEKNGVRRIDPKGERFDPNFHQAIFEVPNPAVPTGTVEQVVQPGFVIGDRVLRPAMVGVSKGGPKAARVPEAPGGSA